MCTPTGDGEISFGGNQDVSGLMNVLEGAAVSAANGAATNGAAQGQAAGAAQPAPGTAQTAAAAAAPATTPTTLEQNQAAEPAAVPATDATVSTNGDSTLTQQVSEVRTKHDPNSPPPPLFSFPLSPL